MLEVMPRDGLVLCRGLDVLWMRTVLPELGTSRTGASHFPRACSTSLSSGL